MKIPHAKHHSPRFLKLATAARRRVREIGVEEVRKLQSSKTSFDLVDVREDSEWRQGSARGAIHLGRGVLERDIEKAIPDPKRRIVLYCGGGFRSALAAESLKKMGYRNVWSLAGGWRAWLESGAPTQKKK